MAGARRTKTSKAPRLEEQLAALHPAREDPRTPEALALLQSAIASPSSFVVAAAAEIVRDHVIAALLPSLAMAFDRFLVDSVHRDPGCRAKLAIAEALVTGEFSEPGPFLRGIRHRQPEPVWGIPPTVDTAAGLRGACAVGLANRGHPDALDELATLLADPESVARANAARALGATGSEAALPLLRFKVLSGDVAADVITEGCSALLALAPARSLPFVAALLDGADESRAESAALALGQSRLADAFAVLKAFSEGQIDSRRRVALLSIGLLRAKEATDYLLDQIGQGSEETAAHAIAALAIQRHDSALRRQVEQAVEARNAPAVREAFERSFAG